MPQFEEIPKLVIPDIKQGDKVSFQLYSEFLDPEFSNKIVFDAPKIPRRMDKVPLSVEYLSKKAKIEELATSASFNIVSFYVDSIPSKPRSSFRHIKFFLNNDAALYQISSGEKIKFATASYSPLARFNNQQYYSKTNYNPINNSVVIINMQSSSFNPSSVVNAVGSGSVLYNPATDPIDRLLANAIVVSSISTWIRPFKISIPRTQFDKLVYTDNIRDFIIFAYASSNVAIDVKKATDRYLVSDPDNTKVQWIGTPNGAGGYISPNPPSYAKVLSLYNKKFSITHNQYVPKNKIDKGNVVFWAATARYIKDNAGNWKGLWLHLDDSKNVYWTPNSKITFTGGISV